MVRVSALPAEKPSGSEISGITKKIANLALKKNGYAGKEIQKPTGKAFASGRRIIQKPGKVSIAASIKRTAK